MHKYEIIISWDRTDNCYVADVPELPGGRHHRGHRPERKGLRARRQR